MKEKKAESSYKEIMAENFRNMGKETDIQIQEAQRVPKKMHRKYSVGIKADTQIKRTK